MQSQIPGDMMQHVHVDRRGKLDPRSDVWAVFCLTEMSCCLGPVSEVQTFWDRLRASGSPITRGAAHYTVPRKLWLCRASIARALRVHPFFQFRNSLLEPKSPHLPRSNSYGLGFRVYGLPRPTQTAAQQRCRSLLSFGAFCNCRHQGMPTQPLIV